MPRRSVPKVNYKFSCELPTRFSDEDNQRILNHATFIPLMEEARFRYFQACGVVKKGQDSPVLQHSIYIRFVSPGKGPATTVVYVATIHIGVKSMAQVYRVCDKDSGRVWVEAVQGLVHHGGYDNATEGFRTISVPDDFRQAVAEYETACQLDPVNPMPTDPTIRGVTSLKPHPGPFRFNVAQTTRWVDEDRNGTLSGNVFWTLIEEGRAAYMGKKSLDLMTKQNAFPFVLHSATLRYYRPGKGNKNVVVDVRTTKMGDSSFVQWYRIRDANTGAIWCETEQLFVCWNVAEKKKDRISGHFRRKVGEYDALPTRPPAKVSITRTDPKYLSVGDTASTTKVYTQQDVKDFAELSEDRNPLHLNPDFAATTRFKKPILHGWLASSLISGLLGMHLPGQGTVYLSQKVAFKKPVFAGSPVTTFCKITKIREDKPIVTLKTWCADATTKAVLVSGEAVVLVNKKLVAPKQFPAKL